MTRASIRDQIVDATGRLHGRAGFKIVKTRRGQGEHLHVDALLVHQRQPTLAEIGQALAGFAPVGNCGYGVVRRRGGGPGRADAGRQDMFFDGDQAHGRLTIASGQPLTMPQGCRSLCRALRKP